MNSQPYSLTWLPFLDQSIPADLTTPMEIAQFELTLGLKNLHSDKKVSLACDETLGDAYTFEMNDGLITVTGGEQGILYGTYRLLMALAAGDELASLHTQAPYYALRMLDCWDNANGTVERGYAGRSLFFDAGELNYDAQRLRQLGRMLASVGINVLCVNNVNVVSPAHRLIEADWLDESAKLADLFRPFGIKLMFSIDYAAPTYHGIDTADPLDERVQAYWSNQADAVYAKIPNLAGFLVKADSEHRPGPFTYRRNHAQGANMLARVLQPHGGVLVWRCFVYNCKQDWRDTATDRPMAAYDHYAYLDGEFDKNVILQVKNGPFDFQVREPVSPLLYAMPSTTKAIEFQLAQEYTGHQIDIYAMLDMWQETFTDLSPDHVNAIAAVSNLGRDENWTGHEFAQLNLFAYGVLAWQPLHDTKAVTRLWCRLSFALPAGQEDALCALLASSRDAYERYTAPLGICWMVNPHYHYGPSPDGYEFSPWGTFHKADRNAVGIDRTQSGTGYVLQYPPNMRAKYDSTDVCDDKLLLFFHRLPYSYIMRDGRTLIQRIYDDHFEGATMVQAMKETLATLDLPEKVKENVIGRMNYQIKNACEWRDVINTFFHRFSGIDDAKGRTIYP